MSQLALKKIENGYELRGNKYIFSISAVDVTNPLGNGAFGVVYKATKENATYAIKQISKSCGIPIPKIRLELQYMAMASTALNGGNIIYAIDSAEDDSFLYIVMPIFDSENLTKFINKGYIQTEIEAIEYFRQICYGLKTLHSLNLIHRDLKTDNVLVNSYSDSSYPYKYYFAISDYGLSTNELDKAKTKSVGTGYTMAPEVKTGVYDQKADIFSIGCIFYKMLIKEEPFSGVNANDIDQKKKLKCISVKCNFKNQAYYSKLTMKILEGCLQTDKNKRLSLSELSTLLDVEKLYTQYSILKLDEPDTSNTINLCEFVRAHLPDVNAQPSAHHELAALSGKLDISIRPQYKRNYVCANPSSEICIPMKDRNNSHQTRDYHLSDVKQYVSPLSIANGKQINNIDGLHFNKLLNLKNSATADKKQNQHEKAKKDEEYINGSEANKKTAQIAKSNRIQNEPAKTKQQSSQPKIITPAVSKNVAHKKEPKMNEDNGRKCIIF